MGLHDLKIKSHCDMSNVIKIVIKKKKGLIISQRWFRCWTYGDEVTLQPAFVIHGIKGCQLLPMVVHDSVVHIWVLS